MADPPRRPLLDYWLHGAGAVALSTENIETMRARMRMYAPDLTPELIVDEGLREFWRKVVYDLYAMVPAGQRPSARWRMSLATFDMVRKATEIDTSTLGGLNVSPPQSVKGYLLLGLPIDFDGAADGVTLVPPESVVRDS